MSTSATFNGGAHLFLNPRPSREYGLPNRIGPVLSVSIRPPDVQPHPTRRTSVPSVPSWSRYTRPFTPTFSRNWLMKLAWSFVCLSRPVSWRSALGHELAWRPTCYHPSPPLALDLGRRSARAATESDDYEVDGTGPESAFHNLPAPPAHRCPAASRASGSVSTPSVWA